MAEYKIRKRSDVCQASGEPFEPGDVIVSAIYEGPEGFERKDVHERHFAAEDAPFCVWRSRAPEKVEDKHRLDYDLALQFLERLLREADPGREGLVYTLTLLLSRKRRVKIRETRRLPEGELLKVVVPRDEDDEVVNVRAPSLDDEAVDGLQRELEGLFDFGGSAPA